MKNPIYSRRSKGGGDYEKVEIDVWVTGKIEEVMERVNPNKKFQDKCEGKLIIRQINYGG